MPKPKKSKVVSLVSAYESGAESEEDLEELSEDENSNESENSNSIEKVESDKLSEQFNEEPKSIESNKIEIEENNSNVSSLSIERKTITVISTTVEMEAVTEVNETSQDKQNDEQTPDESEQHESIYTVERGFPPGCDQIKLPPAPSAPCSESLQNKIIQVSERMKPPYNYSINNDIQKKKLYKNPSIYEKLIEAHGIDEYGSNFPNYIPDLREHGYLNYLELDEAQRNEWAKKEKEKKDRTKIEMVVGTKKK